MIEPRIIRGHWEPRGPAWRFATRTDDRGVVLLQEDVADAMRIEATIAWEKDDHLFSAGLFLFPSEPNGSEKPSPGYCLVLSRRTRAGAILENLEVVPLTAQGDPDPQSIDGWTRIDTGTGCRVRLSVTFAGTLVTIAVNGRTSGRFALRAPIRGRPALFASRAPVTFEDIVVDPGGAPIEPAVDAVVPCQVNAVWPNPARPCTRLSGPWEFRTDPEDQGWEDGWFRHDDAFPQTLQVPGIWEAQGVGGPGKRNRLNCGHERYMHADQEVAGTYTGSAWYRRRFDVPESSRDGRVWLKLGGVHAVGWMWVNGQYVNAHSNHIVAARYDITPFVKRGQPNTLVVLVDNRLPTMRGCFNDYIVCFGGLFRDVEIEHTGAVWIRDVWAKPELDHERGRLQITLENLSDAPFDGDVLGRMPDASETCEASTPLTLSPGERRQIDLLIPLEGVERWSPRNPTLYRLDVLLRDGEGRTVDGWTDRVGWRKLSVDDTHIYLNDAPVFIAGLSDYGFYPETIAPPATRGFHLENLARVREYGFNYRRHHTYVPITEYLQAADETGIMVQMETPYPQPLPVFEEIVLHTRNHVSVTTVCMTNESYTGDARTAALYHEHKRLDPTRFTIDSDGQSAPLRDTSDFWTPFPFNVAYYLRTYPRLVRDLDYVDRPAVLHEFLNMPSLPNPRSIEKFTAALRPPPAFVKLRDWADRHGLSDRLDDFVMASYEHQKQYTKLGYETARSHPRVHGLGHWKGKDNVDSGQVGLFTAHYEPKAMTAGEMRALNGPTCLIALLERWTMHRGDALCVPVVLSHFGDCPLSARLEATLREGDQVVATAARDGIEIEAAGVHRLGHLMLEVPRAGDPARMKLELSLHGGEESIRNAWDIWVFAAERRAIADIPVFSEIYPPDPIKRCFHNWSMPELRAVTPDDLMVTDMLHERVIEHLRGGGRVLLTETRQLPHRDVVFSPGWWTPHPPHTLGICMTDHPALAGFPHDSYAGFQLEHLTAAPVLIDRLPFRVVPIIDAINNPYHDLEHRGFLVETRAGPGRLLICGLKLFLDLPESRGLLDALVAYMAGSEFAPDIADADATRALRGLETCAAPVEQGAPAADIRWEDDDQDKTSLA